MLELYLIIGFGVNTLLFLFNLPLYLEYLWLFINDERPRVYNLKWKYNIILSETLPIFRAPIKLLVYSFIAGLIWPVYFFIIGLIVARELRRKFK